MRQHRMTEGNRTHAERSWHVPLHPPLPVPGRIYLR